MTRLSKHAAAHARPLHVTVQGSGTRHVITVEGELDLNSAPSLTTAVETVVPHAKAIVLDLAGVSFIDSSGVNAIFNCHSQCRRHSVGLALTQASPQVERIFELLGVTAALPQLAGLQLV